MIFLNLKKLLLVFLIVPLLSGCSLSETNTEMPTEGPVVASELPSTSSTETALCDSLAAIFSGAFQAEMPTTTASFRDILSEQTVNGCLSMLSVPSENIPSLEDAISLSDAILKTNGWEEDIRYSAGGASGSMIGYRQNDSLCLVTTELAPVDDSLCSADEPFSICMDRLSAEQKNYKVTLSCAVLQDSSVGTGNLPKADFSGFLPPAITDELVQSMVLMGIPPMIPSSFMIGDEMVLHANVLSMEEGLYEISIDFGEDCDEASVCHFGVLAGSLTSGNELYSTPNIFVDVERSVPVTLINGITGYYIEGLCEASCSDSLIVWNQDFYQYIIGSDAASQAFLLDVVNSALTNQAP